MKMKNIEKLKKEIKQMVDRMTIEEIEQRIKEDELYEENIELISNNELKYENVVYNSIKEEVNVWKNEILELVA